MARHIAGPTYRGFALGGGSFIAAKLGEHKDVLINTLPHKKAVG